jgi:uncharacterized protein (TIGR03792 family)
MFFEVLRFRVRRENQEEFLRRNTELWGDVLARTPGFIMMRVYRNDANPEEIIVIDEWESKAAMAAFPKAENERLDALMKPLHEEMRVEKLTETS